MSGKYLFSYNASSGQNFIAILAFLAKCCSHKCSHNVNLQPLKGIVFESLNRFKSNELWIWEAEKMNIQTHLQIIKCSIQVLGNSIYLSQWTKVYFRFKSISFLLCVLSSKTSRNLMNDREICEILPC